jgi:hypothetical protein
MFISGPRASSLGSEQGTTLNAIMKGMGGDHITSSAMFEVSGSVGIGTSVPGTTLDVVGTGKISGITTFGSTGGNGLRVYGASGTNQWDIYLNGANLRFSDNTGTGSFVVDRAATFSSNVTADRIAIAGTIDANARLVIGEDSSTTNVGYIRLRGHDVYEGNIYKNATYGIQMDTDSNARPIRIDGSAFITGIIGNVGIGTTNPSYKLEIQTGATAAGLWVQTGGTTSGYVIADFRTGTNLSALQILGNGTATFGSTVDGTIFNSTSNAFRFSGNNAISLVSLNSQNVVKINAAGYWGTQLVGANDQGILINNSGNVGIGTTSPSYKLDVIGGINSSTATSSGTGTLTLGTTDGPRIAGRITASPSPSYSSTGKLGFSITTWGANTDYGLTEVMAIDMRNPDNRNPVIWMNPFGGKVGIGNTNPNNVVDIYDQTYWSNTVGVLAARTRGGGTFITGRAVTAETSNQTQTIATCSAAGTNERIFIKVQVVNVSAVSNYGNVHVGYAIWSGSGGSSVTTMVLDTGNSNISNTNVGSLSWSGNNLQYTTNRGGNYELNSITIWGSARDTGTIS